MKSEMTIEYDTTRGCIIRTFSFNTLNQDHKMSGTCSLHGINENCLYNFGRKNSRET